MRVSIPLISGLFDYAKYTIDEKGIMVSIPLISGLFDYSFASYVAKVTEFQSL